ncbi:hypothetical protein [Streptomyces sp. NPDC005262]|uniref:hypothetical protein n=1 Tax=Streptomyces sp. NPDC005262 TaxID=3364710 RepID=UPI00367FE0E3
MNLSRERGYKPAATEMAAYDAALKEGAQDRGSSDKAEIGVLNGTSEDWGWRRVCRPVSTRPGGRRGSHRRRRSGAERGAWARTQRLRDGRRFRYRR